MSTFVPNHMLKLFETRTYFKNIDWSLGSGSSKDADKNRVECAVDEGEVISSENSDHPGFHSVMIDIDRLNVWLRPSSTAGNYHLYIHKAIPWNYYLELLEALHKCGIIETGYLEASRRRKATFLRVPWMKKGAEKLSTPAQIEQFLSEAEAS